MQHPLILELYHPMKKSRRAGNDARNLTRSLASAAATTLKGNELALASGHVIAKRAALGVAALVDPANADHVEFSRMMPEKMAAFSAASAILQRRSQVIAEQVTRFAIDEATITLHAAAQFAVCRTPADLLAAQGRFAVEWFGRVLSQSMALGSLALSAGGAMLVPVHRAATGNARRLGR